MTHFHHNLRYVFREPRTSGRVVSASLHPLRQEPEPVPRPRGCLALVPLVLLAPAGLLRGLGLRRLRRDFAARVRRVRRVRRFSSARGVSRARGDDDDGADDGRGG